MTEQTQEGLFITRDQVKAVNVLIAAAGVAQKKGAFELSDANTVYQAIQAFAPPPQETETQDEKSE